MNLQKNNIMVAEYWTELPPKAGLENKLHTALIEIKERLAEQQHIEKSCLPFSKRLKRCA